LGIGSYGIVVKAEKSGHPYALKTLLAKPEIDLATQIRLFYHEGKILKEINHPRVPKCLDLFALQESHFIVQEFIPGTPLSTMLENGYSFSEAEIKQIILQLLEILGVLHTQGIVHRDLRLSNLILYDHKLFVVDFGFARKFTPQHKRENIMLPDPSNVSASSSYLAHRRAISPLSDFFGVGLVALDLSANWPESGPNTQDLHKSLFYQTFVKTMLQTPESTPSARAAIDQLRPLL
jgi:serine/threonine-protein kinase